MMTPMRANAQQPQPRGASVLSSYVPDEVVFYAEFDNLNKAKEQLTGTDVWRFIRQFAGQASDQPWQTLLTQELGLDAERTLDVLSRTKFSVAVRRWDQLDQSVIIVLRPAGFSIDNTISLFVGNDVRRKWRKGRVQMAEAGGGLFVAVGRQVVVVSPTAETDSLMDRIVARLNNRGINSLARHPPFREQVMHLPRARLALAYWNQRDLQNASNDSAHRWLDAFEVGVLGLYVRDGRTEIVAREAVIADQEFVYRPRVRPHSLEMLPQSTLAAWATTIKPDEIWDSLEEDPPHETVGRLMRAVRSRIDADSFRSEVLDRLGPRMITVLGCEFATDERRPLVGVLLECVATDDVLAKLDNMVDPLTDADPVGELTLRKSDHLGTTIYELQLARPPQGSVRSMAQLFAQDLRPALAVMDGWLITSTSPQHVRQILDAARGLTPSLGDMVNLQVERERIRRSVGVVVVQPAFAVSTLRFWRQLLNESVQPVDAPQPGETLGVALSDQSADGRVVIASVDSNGVSAATLRPGDVILACDGKVLSLSDTLSHFSQLISQRQDDRRIALRLMRDDRLMDVEIALQPPGVSSAQWSGSNEVEQMLAALAPIEDLASRLGLAVYASIKPPRTAASSEFSFHFLQIPDPQTPEKEEEIAPATSN